MRISSCRVHNSLRFLAVLLVASVALISSTTAQAQLARSWNTTDGDWSVAINWLPNGAPGTLDGAFIGSSAVAENATVTLDQNDTVAALSITDGMELVTDGNSLTVNGDTTISGENEIPIDCCSYLTFPSTLHVSNGGGLFDFRTEDMTISNGARVTGSGILQIDGTLTLVEPVDFFSGDGLLSDGVVNFTGASGKVLVNNNVIGRKSSLFPIAVTLNQLGGGRLDLDGTSEVGRVEGSVTVNGTELSDSFDGVINLGKDDVVNMNLSNGWTLGPDGLIVFFDFSGGGSTQLNGSEIVIEGRISAAVGSQGLVLRNEINADTVFQPLSIVAAWGSTETDFNGATTINGGTFTTDSDGNEGGNIDFNGATTIHGGTFNTFSTNINDGDVDFNGPTTWAGDVTINGIAQQQGDATVSASSVITADAFDMDGSSGNTSWDINQRLTINAQRINSTTNTFNGTLHIGGIGTSFLAALNVNLLDPTNQTWTMAGTMNLEGGFTNTNRLSGAPVRITGDVNVSDSAAIMADATFGGTSSLNFDDASTVLRINGRASVEIGTNITGDGTLEVGTAGRLSIEPSISTGDVRVVNRGTFDLGLARGVVAVPEFENISGAILRADVGRNTAGTDSDILQVADSAAVLDGFVQPNVVNIGGDFEPPEIGDAFTILTSINGLSGTFDGALDSLLGGLALEWSVVHNPANVQVQLTDIGGLLGDYNGDGAVNAADYTVWRNTLGSMTNLAADGSFSGNIDADDYTVWKSNFGQTLGSGSGAVGSVPEPTTFLLAMLAATGLGCLRRRK